jgi:hypothetical protein
MCLHIHNVALKNDIDTQSDGVRCLFIFVLKKFFKKIGDVGLIFFENFENFTYSCTLQTSSTFGIH